MQYFSYLDNFLNTTENTAENTCQQKKRPLTSATPAIMNKIIRV